MDDVVQAASGAILAQDVVAAVRTGKVDAGLAWLRYAELEAKHGRHSPACRAFITELSKRAAR